MDEVDSSNERQQREAPLLIEASKKPVGPLPTGRCHYCDEILNDTMRWCDAGCRDAWEREK